MSREAAEKKSVFWQPKSRKLLTSVASCATQNREAATNFAIFNSVFVMFYTFTLNNAM